MPLAVTFASIGLVTTAMRATDRAWEVAEVGFNAFSTVVAGSGQQQAQLRKSLNRLAAKARRNPAAVTANMMASDHSQQRTLAARDQTWDVSLGLESSSMADLDPSMAAWDSQDFASLLGLGDISAELADVRQDLMKDGEMNAMYAGLLSDENGEPW